MDFMEWVVCNMGKEDLDKLGVKFLEPLAVGSMCSGMATAHMALHAIRNALVASGRQAFDFVAAFKAEADPKKSAFLRRRLRKNVSIFPDNASVLSDGPGNMCDVLTCGIV